MFVKFVKSDSCQSGSETTDKKKCSEAEEQEKRDFAHLVAGKKAGLAKETPSGAGDRPAASPENDSKAQTFTTQMLGEEGGKDQTFSTRIFSEEGGRNETLQVQISTEGAGAEPVSVALGIASAIAASLLDNDEDEDEDEDEEDGTYSFLG